MSYQMGHDCEFFVKGDNQITIPVCGKVGGTKKAPVAVANSRVGSTYQEDGVAIELGMSPCNVYDFLRNARFNLGEVSQVLANHQLYMSGGSEAVFDLELLKQYPQAMTIGCSPDRNAWDRGARRMGLNAELMGGSRFTGGHIHFSCPMQELTDKNNPRLVNGVPVWAVVQLVDALALTAYPKYDFTYQRGRYAWYGLPGLYRNKPYGFEYRTPSNTWLWDGRGHDESFLFAAMTVVQACGELSEDKILSYYERINWDAVRKLLDLTSMSFSDRENHIEFVRLQSIYFELRDAVGELRT